MEKLKINAEQAKTVVKDDGSIDYDALGKITSEKETAAAQAKEQEIANNSENPGGGTAGGENKKRQMLKMPKVSALANRQKMQKPKTIMFYRR